MVLFLRGADRLCPFRDAELRGGLISAGKTLRSYSDDDLFRSVDVVRMAQLRALSSTIYGVGSLVRV